MVNKMKALIFSSALGMLACLVTGCFVPLQAEFKTEDAALCTYQRLPLTLDGPFDATEGNAHGVAEMFYIYEPFISRLSVSAGDATIKAAMRQGQMKHLAYADYEKFSILFGIFGKISIHAYGKSSY